MPTVTVDGEKSFEVEAGKKLVLAIQDAGLDIITAAAGTPGARRAASSCSRAMYRRWSHSSRRLARNRPRAEYPAVLPDSRAERPVGPRDQPLIGHRSAPGDAAHGLNLSEEKTPARRASGTVVHQHSRPHLSSVARRTSCSARCAANGRRSADSGGTWSDEISSCEDGTARRASRGGPRPQKGIKNLKSQN